MVAGSNGNATFKSKPVTIFNNIPTVNYCNSNMLNLETQIGKLR